MALYFSKSSNGFYDDQIHKGNLMPSDAVSITKVQHQALMSAQGSGQIISSDSSGNPVSVSSPPLTSDQELKRFHVQVKAALSVTSDVMQAVQEAIILGTTSVTAPDVLEYTAYCKSLRELLKSTSLGSLPTAPPTPQGI